jgi:hypothetical protein
MNALVVHTKGDGVLGDTSATEVAHIARDIASAERAVVHVHGGLVTKAKGMDTAIRLDGFYRSGNVLPAFFVWESGPWETVRNNAKEIFDEKLFQILLKRLLKHAGGKLLQSAGGRDTGVYEPLTDQDAAKAVAIARKAELTENTREPLLEIKPAQAPSELTPQEEKLLKNELAKSTEFQDAVDSVLLGMDVKPPPGARSPSSAIKPAKTHLSPQICDELRASSEPGARGLFDPASLILHAIKTLARVIMRFSRKRDHGFYTTVVEELLRELYLDAIGGKIWGLMKQDTLDTFVDDPSGKLRGGSLFLREFAAEIRTRHTAQKSLPQLSIVTHSAGSIWACHFMQSIADMRSAGKLPTDFRIQKLVFLAPACTCRLFAKVLANHGRTPLFDDLRIYALADQLEAGYWEVPPLYPRSLLYLVSGLFEDEPDQPLLGMQRYQTATEAYDEPHVNEVRTFLTSKPDRVVWSIEERGSGLVSDAHKHGGFDQTTGSFVKTMQAVMYLLSH